METGSHALVRVRGHLWSVLARTRHGDCEALRLRSVEPGHAGVVRTLLTPFDRVIPVARPTSWRHVRIRRWLHLLRRAALDAHPFGGLRTADESRIQLLPYQLEPALAIIRHGAARVLIADDVGLGKTIQAGLILRELADRGDTLRAIVVMPAGLRDQWREELRDRFDLASSIVDASWLASTARDLPAEVNPWSLPGIYLASYDFVKRPEVLRPLEDVTWDAAVFDEAHTAALGTDRRAAADGVAVRARRVVLLTATPHGGDEPRFEALRRLGLGADSGGLVTFRRSRADAGPVPPRRTVLLRVAPTSAERRMHRLLGRYASRIQREASVDSRGTPFDPARGTLAAIVLRKRALSGAGSLLASAARRQVLLAGREPVSGIQLALPLGVEDPLPDDVADETLAAPGLIDATLEQRALAAIVRAAREAAERETKTDFLLRFLRRVREPVIVFTEYRDTLARLAVALERAGHHPLLLHGGLLPDERGDVRRAFNADGSLLLATDAASEGLNLHHRCRIVVHYELPWSPVRLQQRTGRVDRIGQQRRVHEIMLVCGDTAERLVLAPLARRIALASRHSASTSRLLDSITESRVAAAVLNGAPLPWPLLDEPTREADSGLADLRADGRAEMDRLIERRRWREHASAGKRPTGVATGHTVAVVRRLRVGTSSPASILVWRITVHDADGHRLHEELVPVALSSGESEDHAREHLRRCLAERLDRIAGAHQIVTASLERRERAVASCAPAAARQIVQAGLFDRRALRDAGVRRRAAEALLSESGDRIEALGAARRLTQSFEVAAKLIIRPSTAPGTGRP
jgi:superfamily II DNA or RNA helicase